MLKAFSELADEEGNLTYMEKKLVSPFPPSHFTFPAKPYPTKSIYHSKYSMT